MDFRLRRPSRQEQPYRQNDRPRDHGWQPELWLPDVPILPLKVDVDLVHESGINLRGDCEANPESDVVQALNAGSFVIDVGEDRRHGSEKHCPWDT